MMRPNTVIGIACREKLDTMRSLLLAFYLFMMLLFAFSRVSADPQGTGIRNPFCLAFSSNMFTGVNEADIRAAMKVWFSALGKNLGIPVDPDPHIQQSVEALAEFGRSHAVDGFAITTPELFFLSKEIKFNRIAIGTRRGQTRDEYVLLVRKGSGIERLDQLKGTDINILESPRMSLALIWLDTVLMEANLGRSIDFFGHIQPNKQPSQVALPVFFGKIDACLVTRASFEVMGELNPQLTKQLNALLTSPPYIPSGFAFLDNAETALQAQKRSDAVRAMERLHETPEGRQILTLTQSDSVHDQPIAILDDSMALLAKHQQLCEQHNRSTAPTLNTQVAVPQPSKKQ
jgi:ABC-type phosphate/phosphonate transport system substrate-binding protein